MVTFIAHVNIHKWIGCVHILFAIGTCHYILTLMVLLLMIKSFQNKYSVLIFYMNF